MVREDTMSKPTNKEIAVEAAMNQIERQFGKGSIMKLGSGTIIEVPVISTGSIALDKALGIGGIPRGRVTEIYGPESSGKNDACPALRRGSPDAGWDCGLH